MNHADVDVAGLVIATFNKRFDFVEQRQVAAVVALGRLAMRFLHHDQVVVFKEEFS